LLDFLQTLSDGVLFGATYALIGIGFTLVFGVMHKLNLSYAAASVGGAYCGLLIVKAILGTTPAWLVFLGAFLSGGVIGWVVYVLCFHFIPLSNPLAPLMSTVGMLLLIDEVIVHLTAGMPQNHPAVFDDVMLRFGEFTLRGDLLVVFGVAVLVGGSLFGALVLRGLSLRHVTDAWDAMDLIFAFAFSAYLLSVGIRAMRWARGRETAGGMKVKWGRILLGSLLVFIEAKNHFHPATNLLQPSNETQAVAMNATAIVLVFLGAWLVVSGVIARFKGQVRDQESSKIVP